MASGKSISLDVNLESSYPPKVKLALLGSAGGQRERSWGMIHLTVSRASGIAVRLARDVVCIFQRGQEPRWSAQILGAYRPPRQTYVPDPKIIGGYGGNDLRAYGDIALSYPPDS